MFMITKFGSSLKFLIFWRIVSIFVIQTYYVPDEYWQSLEVAHRFVFGYGYITWEWEAKIRSYIYPFIISIIYKLLAIVNLDYATLLIYLPRMLQAVVSGYADYKFFTWTKNDFALFLLGFNWFWYYCASRTLTNSLETSLTTIALSIFPWRNKQHSNHPKFLWIVGFMCAIRPTAAIMWTPLCIYHIFRSTKSTFGVLKEYIFIGFCTLCYSITIDSYCYGEFTFTSWEFFKVNVLNSVADHYGKQHCLWYLTVGLPVVIGIPILYFPVAAYHVIKHWRLLPTQTICLFTILWTVCIYSLLPHKEFRFIMALLPMFIFICTSVYFSKSFRFSESIKQLILAILILSNVLLMLYTGLIHQRGPMDVMKMYRKGLVINEINKADILFLMPCHSTPYYSHLHVNISMRFLTCEPNLKNQPQYLDEADQFYKNPMRWLQENYNNSSLPTILIMYDNLVPSISRFLKNYQPVMIIFHTHFPQPNCGENVMIYKRKLLKRKQ